MLRLDRQIRTFTATTAASKLCSSISSHHHYKARVEAPRSKIGMPMFVALWIDLHRCWRFSSVLHHCTSQCCSQLHNKQFLQLRTLSLSLQFPSSLAVGITAWCETTGCSWFKSTILVRKDYFLLFLCLRVASQEALPSSSAWWFSSVFPNLFRHAVPYKREI